MPHKVYHGKTGVVYNVTRTAVGVIIYKKVGNRYLEKRVNLRVEHVSHSRSREECKQQSPTPHKSQSQPIHDAYSPPPRANSSFTRNKTTDYLWLILI